MATCIAKFEAVVGKGSLDAQKLRARKAENKKDAGIPLNKALLDTVNNELIPSAIADSQRLIANVQAVYPDLINTRGEFLRDLRVKEQLSLPFEEEVAPKKLVKTKEKKDAVREEEAPVKTGSTKPSPKKVVGGKQPASTKKVGSGTAKLKAVTAKGKPKRQQAADPKAEEDKSQPARDEEPEQVERTERETPRVAPTVAKPVKDTSLTPIPPEILAANERLNQTIERLQPFLSVSGPYTVRNFNPQQQAAVTRAERALSAAIRAAYPNLSAQSNINLYTALQNNAAGFSMVAADIQTSPVQTSPVQVSPVEASPEIASIVETIETSVGEKKETAIAELLYAAMIDDTSGLVEDTSGALKFANDYDLLWSPSDRPITENVVIETLQSLYADEKNTTFADQQAMWDFAIQHDMFRDAYIAVTSGGKGIPGFTPTNPKATMKAALNELGIADVLFNVSRDATDKLTALLDELLEYEGDMVFAGHTVAALKAANKKIDVFIKAGANLSSEFVPGTKLSDMLRDGKIAGLPFEGSKTLKVIATPESYTSADTVIRDMEGRNKIFDTNGKPITKPLSISIVKPLVTKMMNKFNAKVRPAHRVYKNLAELKRKDPKIYAEALASRKDGSAIPDTAAGYAFNNRLQEGKILIFSDNIANEHQARFTVLHEVVGHFGLGSLMPTKDFRKLMDDIYRADPVIRANAEALKLIRSRGAKNKLQKGKALGHYEAIEEALADRAAELNNSIVNKVMNVIRKFLRAMGFRFHDDMTRFFIDQSLRYQRTGMLPDASAPAVYQHLKVLNERSLEGRASVPNFTPSDTTFYSQTQQQQRAAGKLGGRSAGARLDSTISKITDLVKRTTERKGIVAKSEGIWGDIKKAAEDIQPMNNLAQFSEGIEKLYAAFVGQAQELAHLKTRYIDGTEFTNRVANRLLETLGLQEKGAPTEEDREQASRGLEMQTMARRGVTEQTLVDLPPLTKTDATGKDKIDEVGVKAARDIGAMTRKQIDAGIQIAIMGNDGLPATDSKGKVLTELFKLDAPLTDNAWTIIQHTRSTIDQSSLDVHLNNILGIKKRQEYLKTQIAEDKKNKNLTERDFVILDNIIAVHSRLYNENAKAEGNGMVYAAESQDRAKRWLYNTLRVLDTKGSDQKKDDWKGKYTPGTQDEKKMEDFITGKYSKDKDIQAVIAQLPQLGKNKKGAGIDSGAIETAVQNIHALATDVTNSEMYTKNSIASAYVPFVRRGKYQVRVQAYDKEGNPIRLTDSLQAGLIYARDDNRTKAKEYADALTDALAKSDPVDNILDANDEVQNGVTFRGIYEVGADSAPLAGAVDYSEIFNTLVRSGINLDAVDRKKLIVMAAAQTSMARRNLQKEFVIGWDPDIHKGVREHLEKQANIAAKNLYKHTISDTLTSNKKLWEGDIKKLDRLQSEYRVALNSKNEAAIFIARRKMDRYQLQYEHAAPTQKNPYIKRLSLNKDGTIKEDLVNGRGLANNYKNRAIKMVSQYTSMASMPAITGDQKLGEVSGIFMTIGTAAQLGGSIAPAAINTTSLITHAAPFLATYNPKTGFGLGHGMPAALQAIFQAGSDLSLFKDGQLDATGSSKAIRAIIEEEKRNPGSMMAKYGLTMDEAEMLFDKTDKGTMTANITNVLTHTQNLLKTPAARKTVETWMFLFTKTEQFNRRVTGLAAYRLERDRMLEAEGITIDKLTKAQKLELFNRVDEAIDFSQGNYEKFNHPSIAQGPILKYLWVYKQFQAITIVLMRHLGNKERRMFLAFFILTAGIKGIPFEEDFADLIDGIMQTFNIDWNGLDAEMINLFTILGLPAGLMMRGPIDHYLGFTYSTRISQSNVLPGTGLLKAGADPWREAKDIIGPVFSAWSGIFGGTAMAGKYLLETVGIRDDVTSGADVLKTGFGLSALKNYARGITYFANGTITNDRGQLVSENVGAMSSVFQFLGFYPASATKQYDVNRINSNATDYGKVLIRGYVDAYIKGDIDTKRNVRRQVREWNKTVGIKSPLYIRKFSDKIKRARKASTQTSVGRSIQALPTSSKPFGKDIAKAFGLNPKGINLAD